MTHIPFSKSSKKVCVKNSSNTMRWFGVLFVSNVFNGPKKNPRIFYLSVLPKATAATLFSESQSACLRFTQILRREIKCTNPALARIIKLQHTACLDFPACCKLWLPLCMQFGSTFLPVLQLFFPYYSQTSFQQFRRSKFSNR